MEVPSFRDMVRRKLGGKSCQPGKRFGRNASEFWGHVLREAFNVAIDLKVS